MANVSRHVVEQLRASLDERAAINLLRRAIRTPSVTGSESGFAHLLGEEMRSLGIGDITFDEFAPERVNVWARKPGTDHTELLLLWGHTDTVNAGDWSAAWAGTEREDPFSAAEIDGKIWGRGASDLKAGICTILSALETLGRAGIEHGPDLVLAFTGDEESGEPGSGISEGARHLTDQIEAGQIRTPDFAIYVEPTMLDVYVAHMGFLLCDITVVGKSAYFGVPELGVDAVQAAVPVLDALAKYSDDLAKRGKHELIGHAFLQVTGISGGGNIAVPGDCTISMIRKVLPNEDLEQARAEIEKVAQSALANPEASLKFEYPTRRDHDIGGTPFAMGGHHSNVDRLVDAIQSVRPDAGKIEAAPYWSELPFISRLGVPGVYFAPGNIKICHTSQEHVVVQDYLDGILALATFLAGNPSK